jgi:hypothetical protein
VLQSGVKGSELLRPVNLYPLDESIGAFTSKFTFLLRGAGVFGLGNFVQQLFHPATDFLGPDQASHIVGVAGEYGNQLTIYQVF